MALKQENHQWYMGGDAWTLTQLELAPERNLYFETVLSQANGHMGVRAYPEERSPAESFREGYLAGVFSHLGPEATKLTGPREFPVSEMVTMPEIFACEIHLAGERFDPSVGSVIEYERIMDMRSGELCRCVTWKSPSGRLTVLRFERFLSVDSSGLACHRISITPLDWEGETAVVWDMDGTLPTLVRFGAKRFPQHPQDHLRLIDGETKGNGGLLHLRTRGTEHDIVIAAGIAAHKAVTDFPGDTRLRQKVTLNLEKGVPAVVERYVAVVTSRDRLQREDIRTEGMSVVHEAARLGYSGCLEKNREVWQQRWATADIQIEGPERDQKIVRFNLFQLLQMAPWKSDRMSLAARALSFNRYRGTYFWDTETFILPFYSCVFPDVARNLLSFRYHTLVGARETAAHYGAKGALYPWMAEPDRGEDHSLFRLTNCLWHQTADIAYAVDEYARVSGDVAFLADKGMEILAETARYWCSKMVTDEAGMGHIDGCMGPDETGAPGRDNGYTNLMAQRNLRLAAHWYEWLAKEVPQAIERLNAKINVSSGEAAQWRLTAGILTIPLIPELNIPLQDQWFLAKPEAPPEVLAFRDNPSVGENPQTREQYRVIKQADIVLATLLLRDQFSLDEIAQAYDFYEPRTLHISSLSRNTHAIVAALLGRPDDAYDWFMGSAAMDIDDFDHCTADGLHAAAIGGCWQGIAYGFGGMRVDGNGCHFHPNLPQQWRSIALTVSYGGEQRRVVLRTGQDVLIGNENSACTSSGSSGASLTPTFGVGESESKKNAYIKTVYR